MFSYKSLIYTLSVLVLASAAYWRLATAPAAADGEDKPDEKKPAVPRSIEDIPLGALEDTVVLQSGDIKITLDAVKKSEDAYLASKKDDPQFKPDAQFQVYMRKQIAFRFLVNALIERHVKENNLEVPKEKFAEQLQKFKSGQAGQGQTYEQFLKDNGLTDEEFQRFLSANCAIEKKAEDSVTEAEVDKLFESAKKQLEDAEKGDPNRLPLRRVSHILFMYKGGQGAGDKITRTKEEAKAAAEAALKKIQDGGDFAQLAKELSDCPSKSQGGDLDFAPREGAMVEPFADAMYKIEKVGSLSPVVETPFGFHVIRLTELRTVADMQKELRKNIRQHLARQNFEKQTQQVIGEGAAKAKFNEKLVPKAEQPKKLDLFPKDE
jgi:parvulin-like peptidyl-prolyl isomerase